MPHTNVRFRFVLFFCVAVGLSLGWMLGGCGSVSSSDLVAGDAGGAGGASSSRGGAGGASSDAGDGSADDVGPSAGDAGGASGAGGAASAAGDAGAAGSSSPGGAGGASSSGAGGAPGGLSTAPACAGDFRGSNPDCQVIGSFHCVTSCANDQGAHPVACVYQAASIYCVAKCSDCRP